MNTTPDFTTFEKNFNAGQSQLVHIWAPADLETPVSAYIKLCNTQDYSFLLESVEGGHILGRYSIIGFAPDLIWRCKNGIADYQQGDADWTQDTRAPLESMKSFVAQSHLGNCDSTMPPMAASGLFGHIGYDMIRHYESIPDNNPDELDIPDSVLIRPQRMVIFDNLKQLMCICTPVWKHKANTDKTAQDVYDMAIARLNEIQKHLASSIDPQMLNPHTSLNTPLSVSSNMDSAGYHAMVNKAKEYIVAGDIFQVVPSQRFTMDFDIPSLELYRSLRRLNPSPFLFHVHFDSYSFVGSSPEILVRVRDNTITIRPIAGTRKRGQNAVEDQSQADDLMADQKELAEHLMLLDLGRNDVGRVSEIGSVNVTDQFTVEYYSHVMHIVSNVEGKLSKDNDIIDALFAGFPAGTVSGAPKIRAMEIIDELETVKRKFYAGAVGYLGGNGDLDTCIALRTALIKDGKLYVQAGGGVVADSDPEAEYQESCNKAQAIISAANLAIDLANKD